LTPHHASAAGCRRSLLLAVGCCCCCHRCCQQSPGVWHVHGTDDPVLRRSSQDRVLAGYAEVGSKSGHVTVTRMKRYAMCYKPVPPCRQRDVDGHSGGRAGAHAPAPRQPMIMQALHHKRDCSTRLSSRGFAEVRCAGQLGGAYACGHACTRANCN
jgi:hypothetical protein